jgi:hypothetical protein
MFKNTSVVKLMGLALCAFSINGCATPSQAYWDAKVKEMCEKDGGVTVYEHIELTREEFKKLGGNEYGEIDIPDETHTGNSDEYYITFSKHVIHQGEPQVERSETKIFRKSDKKELSVMVIYGRGGGDIPNGISHPSHFSCRDLPGFNSRLIKSTVHVIVGKRGQR